MNICLKFVLSWLCCIHKPYTTIYGPYMIICRPCMITYGPYLIIYEPYMITSVPCMIIYGSYIIIYGPYMITYGPCTMVDGPCSIRSTRGVGRRLSGKQVAWRKARGPTMVGYDWERGTVNGSWVMISSRGMVKVGLIWFVRKHGHTIGQVGGIDGSLF